jgi:hypothetical protein
MISNEKNMKNTLLLTILAITIWNIFINKLSERGGIDFADNYLLTFIWLCRHVLTL